MRVGVLTGGGDAPGLNPAIKGLVYRGSELGLEVFRHQHEGPHSHQEAKIVVGERPHGGK